MTTMQEDCSASSADSMKYNCIKYYIFNFLKGDLYFEANLL